MSEPIEKLSDFKIVNLTHSNYLKPLRVEFKINGIPRIWDYLQIHDSCSILIYNKTRSAVVLVKQFRPSAYVSQIPDLANGSVIDTEKYPVSNGYTIELCSGILDKNLPVKEIAREEILEECGYDVPASRIKQIFSFRNVGITGQTSNIFYVEVEDKDKVAAGGGLRAEGEFIEVIEMSVPDFRAYVNSVELNSPTGLAAAALWFFANIFV